MIQKQDKSEKEKEEKGKDNGKNKKAGQKKNTSGKVKAAKKNALTVATIFTILLFAAIPEIIAKAIEEQFILFFQDPWGYLQDKKEWLDGQANWVFSGYEEYSYEDELPLSESQICAMIISELEREMSYQKACIIREAEEIVAKNGYCEEGKRISMTSFYTNLPDIPYEYYSKIIAAYSISRPKEELNLDNMLCLLGQSMDEHSNTEFDLKVPMYSDLEYTEHTTTMTVPTRVPVYEPVEVLVEATLEEIGKSENLRIENGKWCVYKTLYKATDEYVTYTEDTKNVDSYEPILAVYFEEKEIDGEKVFVDGKEKLYEYVGKKDLILEEKEIKYAVFNCEPIDMRNLARPFGIGDIDAVHVSANPGELEEELEEANGTKNTKDTKDSTSSTATTTDTNSEVGGKNTYRDLINTKAEVLETMMKDTIELHDQVTLDTIPYSMIVDMCNEFEDAGLSGNRVEFIKNALSLQGLVPFEANALPQGPGWNSIWLDRNGNLSGKGLGSMGYLKWALQTSGFEFDVTTNCNTLEQFVESAEEIHYKDLKPGDIGILLSPNDDHSIVDYNYDTSKTDLNRVGIMASGNYNVVGIFLGVFKEKTYGELPKDVLLWASCNPISGQTSIIKTYLPDKSEPDITSVRLGLKTYPDGASPWSQYLDKFMDDERKMQYLTNFTPTRFYRISDRMEDEDLLTDNMPNLSQYGVSRSKADILLLAKTIEIISYEYEDLPMQGYDARVAIASVLMNHHNYHLKSGLQFSLYDTIASMRRNNELFVRGVQSPSTDDITYFFNLINGNADEKYQQKTLNCINYLHASNSELDEFMDHISNKNYTNLEIGSINLRDLSVASDAIKGEVNIFPEDVIYFIYFRFTKDENHFNSDSMYFNPLTGAAYVNEDGSYHAYYYGSFGDMQFFQLSFYPFEDEE